MAVSAQRRRRALVAVVAALIAAGAFYLAMEYAGKTTSGSPTTATTTAPPVATTAVVVASGAIAEGTLLDSTSLKTQAVPDIDLPAVAAGAQAPYYTSVAALTTSKEYAAIAIAAGTIVQSSMVTTSPTAGAAPVAGLPAVLPAGYVAIALPYSPSATSGTGMGTGGFIQADDRIDILVNNGGGVTYWAYQDVLVLAIGQSTGAPVASSSASPAASSAASASAELVMVELPKQDAAAMASVVDESTWIIQYLIVSSNDYPSPSAGAVPGISAGTGNVTNPNTFFGG